MVSGLVLNFVPDPAQAVHEVARVTRADGRVAAYVWDYAGGMEFVAGQGPAPSYVMSPEEPRRATLREELRRRLPAEADGSIPLVARAWAVAGPCLDSVSR